MGITYTVRKEEQDQLGPARSCMRFCDRDVNAFSIMRPRFIIVIVLWKLAYRYAIM